MSSIRAPLFRLEFSAEELWTAYPPRLHNKNKQLVFDKAYPSGKSPRGKLKVTRWEGEDLPAQFHPQRLHVEFCPGFYDYAPTVPDALEWHLNFGDRELFGYYGGDLFAQDEVQVAEHPILASVREALLGKNLANAGYCDGGSAVLIMGVDRRCSFEFRSIPDLGLEDGIYGNNFSRASLAAIDAVTTLVEPPTLSNIISVVAPGYKSGRYTRSDIKHIFSTAFIAFAAAQLESTTDMAPAVVIHSGWWGCGAFGGDRTLMSLLQFAAAELAGIQHFVFHAGDEHGVNLASESWELTQRLLSQDPSVDWFLDAVYNQGFHWGESNHT